MLSIPRLFTHDTSIPVYEMFTWEKHTCEIRNHKTGQTVFSLTDAEFPVGWSAEARNVAASKYFRKAGVPNTPDGKERSIYQAANRMATHWMEAGLRGGYFGAKDDAQAFRDELVFMIVAQMAAPNSPQWFNTGLGPVYGIKGAATGSHWRADPTTGKAEQVTDVYEWPQPHACFIQSVEDRLVGDGSIMDLVEREASLFKYGSGTGTNFSTLRAANEKLTSGGVSSGTMAWLKVLDAGAGAVKSGGTTRRAAKMVILNVDHPDIQDFINLKAGEELKVRALVEGAKAWSPTDKEYAKKIGLELTYDYTGQAYATVNGQNANFTVRISDDFMDAVTERREWSLTERTSKKTTKTVQAADLWNDIALASWRSADPGLQFDNTINAWHTCPSAGRINASNPCSEYMFLDNTACNLASINLLKFLNTETGVFDSKGYAHAVRLWTIVLEISVYMASYPSKEIAELSWKYRTLGLGYANLGAVLMCKGIPYDSDAGRAFASVVTALLTGYAYKTSHELAQTVGPFPGWEENKFAMEDVMRKHEGALSAGGSSPFKEAYARLFDEGVAPAPLSISDLIADVREVTLPDAGDNWEAMVREAQTVWQYVTSVARKGFRNAQVSVIAPTGTIGIVMDCDTTGAEPCFSLVSRKQLAGGGYIKLVNKSLPAALKNLGYDEKQILDIIAWVIGHAASENYVYPSGIDSTWSLRDAIDAYTEKMMDKEAVKRSLLESLAFASTLKDLDGTGEFRQFAQGFFMLSEEQTHALDAFYCGRGTVAGAPHLATGNYKVFACAMDMGALPAIQPTGHVEMLAAIQPFVSGSISKTVNLPSGVSVDDVRHIHDLAYAKGLKCIALYRDGSKGSQPLSTKTESTEQKNDGQSFSAKTATLTPDTFRAFAASKEGQRIIAEMDIPVRRKKLNDTARAIRHKFSIGEHDGYIHVGVDEAGNPRELFINMSKEGSTLRGMVEAWAVSISLNLQYHVPLSVIVDKYRHQQFEPSGMTANPEIRFAKSIVDYVARFLGNTFIPGYRDEGSPKATIDISAKPDDTWTWKIDTNVAPATVAKKSQTTGNVCAACGGPMKQAGTCLTCQTCGNTSGCS